MTNISRPRLTRFATQLPVLAFLTILGLLDIDGDLLKYSRPPVAAALIVLAVGTAAVWLPQYRKDSRLLPVLVAALAVGSMVVTIAKAPTEYPLTGGSWGTCELVGMLLALYAVARKGAAGPAAAAAILGVLAVAMEPLRLGAEAAAFKLTAQAVLAISAVSIGLYLRRRNARLAPVTS